METIAQNTPNDFIETILTSFEDRIQKIETAFSTSEAVNDSSNELMSDFHHSLFELRNERIQLNTLLRENLARKGSLRKNDYDCLMGDLFTLLSEKEKEAENQFNSYIEDQKLMVQFLRHGILEIKNIEDDDYKTKIETFKTDLENIIKKQAHVKEQAINKFQEFQNIHQKITGNFQQLLENSEHVHCHDLKKLKNQLLEELV